MLTITAARAPSEIRPYINNYQYTSGLLTTYESFSQTYGYFEIRADMPESKGVGRPSGCCRRTVRGRRSSTSSRCADKIRTGSS